MLKVLIIVPAYNEEKSILKTVYDIKKHTKYDYIVVNDGSKDSTKKICIENKIDFLDLPHNLGIGGAVQTGYKYALYKGYDVAIQFDGDGQHDANYLKLLVKELEDADMVIGSRFMHDGENFKSTKIRRVGIKWISKLIKICTNKKISDPTSGLRCCNKKIINIFALDYPIDYPEPDTTVSILKKGFRVKEIPVKMNCRVHGKSSITALKSIYYMIKVSFSIIITNLTSRR